MKVLLIQTMVKEEYEKKKKNHLFDLKKREKGLEPSNFWPL